MTFAEKKIDYGLIPVIDVSRDLLGQRAVSARLPTKGTFPTVAACSST